MFKIRNATVLLSTTILGGWAAPALAQTPPQPVSAAATTVGEIIVTASKRAENIRLVPSSVTAVSAKDLDVSGTVHLQDYTAEIPGLTVQNISGGGGAFQYTIRGVTTGNDKSQTVGIYIDDTYLASPVASAPDIDPADLQQVEVLRGPQGTLYGAGSLGGLIKYVTKAPSYDAFSGRIEVDGSSVDHGGLGYAVRGAVNAPLSDSVAVRASVVDRQDPGFIDNAATGQKDVNRNVVYGGRVAVGIKVTSDVSVRLSAYHEDSHAYGNPVIDLNGTTGKPLEPDLVNQRAFNSDNSKSSIGLYVIHVEDNFGWARLVSTTSFEQSQFLSTFDYSKSFAPILTSLYHITNVGVPVVSNTKTNTFTQEIRLTSSPNQRLEWQVGAFYTESQVNFLQVVDAEDFNTGAPFVLPTLLNTIAPHNQTSQIAGFADLDYHITKAFDIAGGLRFSHDTAYSDNTTTGAVVGGTSRAILRFSDNNVTFLVNPRYRFSDQVMGYVRIASGYQPGGPNSPIAGTPNSYGPDTTTNYEAGLKAQLLDKTLTLDLAAYYIKWSQIQVFGLSSIGTSYTFNGGSAHAEGIESSVVYRPFRGLTINANAALSDPRLDVALPPPHTAKAGAALPDTPRWAAQIGADYRFPLVADWDGSVGASYSYVGDRQGTFTTPRYTLPAYSTVDLRVGVERGRYRVGIFANNVTDSRGYLSDILLTVREITVTTPRTVGVSLSSTF